MMVKRFLAILVCFVLVMGTMPVLADTADIQYTVKSTKVELTDYVPKTPAEYKFKISGGTKEYILLDSAWSSGKREFLIMTESLAGENACALSEPSNTNYYYFIKPNSGANWDGSGTNYAYDPENPNSLASVINSDAVVDSMVDEAVQGYVQTHTWKSEPVWAGTEKPAREETVSKYALPSINEYLAYKDKIGTVATEAGKTSARQWYFRTPFCDGSASAYAMNAAGDTIRNWSFSDYWNTSFRVCFYVSEDFFKNVKLDTASLGVEVVNKVDFKNIMTKAEMLTLGYTETELDAAKIFNGVSHTTNPGVDVTSMSDTTPAEYKFSLPGSNRVYSIIDTYYKNDGTREFYAVTDYTASSGIETETLADNRYRFAATAEYTWDGSSEKYIWDPTDTNTLAGFINSSGFISEMIDEAVNTYVVEHSYKFEPASEATASAKAEVSSKYALLSLSELNAYKDRIGVLPCEYNVSTDVMTTTSNSWWVRTPAVKGGAGAMIWHKTNAKPSWQEAVNAWGKTIRPSFHLSESFFKNVKLDTSKLGYAVIDMVDFESIMTKDEALALGYTEAEWNILIKKDISVQTNDIVKISCDGGTRVKSGYTLTVSGVQEYDTVQFYASDDGVYGYPIDGATNTTLKLTNDLEKKYIAAVVTKFDGSELVSNKLYCGENLPSYSGWVNVNFVNEFDDADYKLKLDSQPGEFTLADYNAATNEMLLMSGIAYSGTEPESAHYQSTDNIQKYDAADENSIAYEINQAEFISSKLIAADYHSYIAEKYWETEKYYGGSDSVTKAKVALPSITELNSANYLARIGKKIGTGTGRQAGYKLRTPYSNATSFYYMRGGSAQESLASSVYYPSRVEFYLNADILKALKIDVANSGSKALDELNLPSVLSIDEANALGYTNDELALLGYIDSFEVKLEGKNKTEISVNIEYSNNGEGKDIYVICGIYSADGIFLKNVGIKAYGVKANVSGEAEALTITLESEPGDTDVVKIFAWDAASLKPLTECLSTKGADIPVISAE